MCPACGPAWQLWPTRRSTRRVNPCPEAAERHSSRPANPGLRILHWGWRRRSSICMCLAIIGGHAGRASRRAWGGMGGNTPSLVCKKPPPTKTPSPVIVHAGCPQEEKQPLEKKKYFWLCHCIQGPGAPPPPRLQAFSRRRHCKGLEAEENVFDLVRKP